MIKPLMKKIALTFYLSVIYPAMEGLENDDNTDLDLPFLRRVDQLIRAIIDKI